MFCTNCGQGINDGALFCPNCGQKQAETNNSSATYPPSAQAAGAPIYTTQPQVPPYVPPMATQKKKHGCLTAFIIVMVILALAAGAVYFLVPGLLRPYDLGIKSTREAYARSMEKLGITKDTAPVSGTADDYKITYGASHAVDTALTSEEITSFFNENRPPYYAVKDVQVRINEDGSIEASGRLDTSYVFNVMLNGQYSKQDAQAALPMLGLIPDKINIYFKATGGVDNNLIQGLNVESFSVMGIGLPQSLITSAEPFITQVLDVYIATQCAKGGSSIDSLEVNNGKLDFNGSLPSSITRIPLH